MPNFARKRTIHERRIPLFVLGGLSDGADGYLARKYDLCSVFGAELDGRADTCFYAAMVVVSLRWYATELRAQLPLILATVVSHLLQWAVAFVKFGRLAAYHSVPGELWAFPGYVPHAVLPRTHRGSAARGGLRVSVACNATASSAG